MVLLAQIPISPGATFVRSGNVAPGVYRAPSGDVSSDEAGLTIRGDGITVDFRGATLEGSDPKVQPDERSGLGLRIEGRNVTVRNLRVRGYKVGIWAKGVEGLRLENVDASYNWKPRLRSTPEKEDEGDWMSYHHNEANEWLRYGAGVYLEGCERFEVKGLHVTGGCNGLMMTRSTGGLVWNSTLDYLSGIGLGMYRSSDNRVMHNRLDYCLRGFSYGVYNRGQDSAAILVYEQSSRNTFAYNSATHSGDGFFLWAGQSTMDSGKGGCDDNLVVANDFSHAPTNGIEATFSRNTFADNLVMECWHGVWGGYSHDTTILGNAFAFDTEGAAIEHGRDILLQDNLFYRGKTAVRLWANEKEDPEWGYPRFNDTRSRDTTIVGNTFRDLSGERVVVPSGSSDNGMVFDLTRTLGVIIGPNTYGANAGAIRMRGPVSGYAARMEMSAPTVRTVERSSDGAMTTTSSESKTTLSPDELRIGRGGEAAYGGETEGLLPPSYPALAKPTMSGDYDPDPRRFETWWNPLRYPLSRREAFGWRPSALAARLAPAPLKRGMDPFLPPGTPRGWSTMRVDEWGPDDGRAPRLWPLGPANDNGVRRFAVTGPKGRWRLASAEGVTPQTRSGGVPGTIAIQTGDAVGERRLELVYTGAKTTDHRGVVTGAGKPVAFGWAAFEFPIAWDVRFFAWDQKLDLNDPMRHPDAPFGGEPIRRDSVKELDYAGYGFWSGGPKERFATVATSSVALPQGRYALDVTSDDGVRVFVDGKRVLDEWHYQGPTTFAVPLTGGRHELRIEHFQIDGYAQLRAKIRATR